MKIKCLHWSKSFAGGGVRITLVGRNARGQKCVVQVAVGTEVLFAVADEHFTDEGMRELRAHLQSVGVRVGDARMERRRALYGYASYKNCFVMNVERGAYELRTMSTAEPFHFDVFHTDICEKTKLATRRGVRMCDWINVRDCDYYLAREANGSETVCIECTEHNLFPVADDDPVRNIVVSLKTLCFDIETEDLKTADDEDDDETTDDGGLFMISIVVVDGRAPMRKYLLTTIPCDPIADVDVQTFDSPCDMMTRCWEIWRHEDPDVLTGYNILQFDYAKMRACCLKYDVDTHLWEHALASSACTNKPGRNRFKENVLESLTMGRRDFAYIEFEGRANIDLLQYAKKTYPTLAQHSLSFVSRHFLQNDKDDVHYKEIWCVARSWRLLHVYDECDTSIAMGDPLYYRMAFKPRYTAAQIIEELQPYANFPLVAKILAPTPFRSLDDLLVGNQDVFQHHGMCSTEFRARCELQNALREANTTIARYCVVDSVLCCQLMDKLQVLENAQQMSYLSFISMEDVYVRGVQWRITNLLYNFAQSVEPFVLDAPSGVYRAWNSDLCKNFKGATVLEPEVGYFPVVVPLDFSSLYPSIIINSNLCYTTIVPPGRLHECADYATISVPVRDQDNNSESLKEFHFARGELGVLPRLERALLAERAKVRAIEPASAHVAAVLDARQLALKVLANSVYGVLGARGARPLAPIAAVITTIGRERIVQVKEEIAAYAAARCRVIYGDTDSNLVQLLDVDTERRFRQRCADEGERPERPSCAFLVAQGLVAKCNGDGFDAPAALEDKARRIGMALAEHVTATLNRKLNAAYKLAYEGAYEHHLQISKKCYASAKFGSRQLTKKGVLSVKRSYADFEKRVYDQTIERIFFTDYTCDTLIGGIVDEVLRSVLALRTTGDASDYVLTSSFKAPRDYAEKVTRKRRHAVDDDDVSDEEQVEFIDRAGGDNFVTRRRYDKKMKFEASLPVNAAIAMNAIGRGDAMMSNSRLEYVYFQTYYGRDFSRERKNERVVDYAHFFRNRHFFAVDVVEYVNRLVKPLQKLIDVSAARRARAPIGRVRRALAARFGQAKAATTLGERLMRDAQTAPTELAGLLTLAAALVVKKSKGNTELGRTLVITLDGVEVDYAALFAKVDMFDEHELRRRIADALPPGKLSVHGLEYNILADRRLFEQCLEHIIDKRRRADDVFELAHRFVSDYVLADAPRDCRATLDHFVKLPRRAVAVERGAVGAALAQFEWKARVVRCIRAGEYRLLDGCVRAALAALKARYAAHKPLTAKGERKPLVGAALFAPRAFDAALRRAARGARCRLTQRVDLPPLLSGDARVFVFELEYVADGLIGYKQLVNDVNAHELRQYARHGAAVLDERAPPCDDWQCDDPL